MNEISKAFHVVHNEGQKYLDMFASFNFKDEKEFHKNEAAIMFCVHVIEDYTITLAKVPRHGYLIWAVYMLDIVEALIDYRKTLVSKYGTYNTYKLYDFMIMDLPRIVRDTVNFKNPIIDD